MQDLLSKLYNLLSKLLPLVKKREVIDNVPLPEPTPTPMPQWTPKNEWDVEIRSNKWTVYPADLKTKLIVEIRRICAEEKLDASQTQNLLCTIQGESGINPFCENLTTFDYGLCQFSQRYYLVEYKMTPLYAKEHPLECVRIMAKNWATRHNNWVAWSSGGAKKWLNWTDKQLANFRAS